MTRPRRLRFELSIFVQMLLAVLPALIAVALLLWISDIGSALRFVVLLICVSSCVAGAWLVRERVVRPLRSLANMLEALREGDYSLRGRWVENDDALGDVMREVNALSQTLYEQRLTALEAGVLFDKLIAAMDIAVLAVDGDHRVRRVNRAGETLLGRPARELVGCSVAELGLEVMLEAAPGAIVSHAFAGGAGRWEVRRRSFREGGRPHELLVISNLSRALREEERTAWRRLVRVIGHELNNSLAPIKSIAATLRKLLDRKPLPSDWLEDALQGLSIVHHRAESLERLMGSYARLARLPPPAKSCVSFGSLVERASSLYGDRVKATPGEDVVFEADRDQIEQVLINLIKNAVEASSADAEVRISWRTSDGRLIVHVEDDGAGLARTESLWVPFFTTKPDGSGIGLALSREIVENHGGTISLRNRDGARGCLAEIVLPVTRPRAS